MIRIIPSDDRYHADHGWLNTRWHFSFSDYYDPDNMNWGALRVFNDDIVQGGGGFDPHPHRDMEIISYILEGALEHRDRLGNRQVSRAGEVQVMSAGRGIVHAEYNASATEPVHFLQMWILPRHQGIEPRWEHKAFTREERHNRLLPIVSSGDVEKTLPIDQDAKVYVSAMDAGQKVVHETSSGRKAYLFAISGGIDVNGQAMHVGDQARIADETRLEIAARDDAELILLDLPRAD